MSEFVNNIPYYWGWLNSIIIIVIIFFWIKSLREPNKYIARSMFNVTKWFGVVWIILTGFITVLWFALERLIAGFSYILRML